MSTRAQIAIEIRPGEWAHTYCHYDGYPSHMLPALGPVCIQGIPMRGEF